MAVSKITVTRGSGEYDEWAHSPSNWRDGIYDDGSIAVSSQNSSYTGLYIILHDANLAVLTQYYFPNGATTALSKAFPGYALAGKYLEFTVDYNAVYVPIVASVPPTTACGAPTSCKVNKTLSSGNVTLSWSGATAGTANSIAGYDVQRRESSDGSTWGSWSTVPGSPTTSTSLSVAPPATAGHYYQFRVRTRGSAGSSYYSGWKTSTNTLQKDHLTLEGFTDSPLTAGMPVKALHMTELHDRINTLRGFYGLSAYAFSPIDERGIAGWTDHVNEIKEAIEGVCAASGKTHEAWIEFSVNCPRADVVEQLRAVVLSL